ncbi:MAG: hypothetical protein ACJ77A_17015 [Actinomycetota bacterium]
MKRNIASATVLALALLGLAGPAQASTRVLSHVEFVNKVNRADPTLAGKAYGNGFGTIGADKGQTHVPDVGQAAWGFKHLAGFIDAVSSIPEGDWVLYDFESPGSEPDSLHPRYSIRRFTSVAHAHGHKVVLIMGIGHMARDASQNGCFAHARETYFAAWKRCALPAVAQAAGTDLFVLQTQPYVCEPESFLEFAAITRHQFHRTLFLEETLKSSRPCVTPGLMYWNFRHALERRLTSGLCLWSGGSRPGTQQPILTKPEQLVAGMKLLRRMVATL